MNAGRFFSTSWFLIRLVFLFLVAFASTILGCGGGVQVMTIESLTLQQVLDEERFGAAWRPAYLMKSRVSGQTMAPLSIFIEDKLPEPYIEETGRSYEASRYHVAYAAERLIREHYAATHLHYKRLERGDLVEVVDEAGGNTYTINESDRDRCPDIADVEGRFVFAIVPPGQAQHAVGLQKVQWQFDWINKAMINVPKFALGTGFDGEIGVRFAEKTPPWKLSWTTTAPGVVQYAWQTLRVMQANEDAYREAYVQQQWRDVTHREMVRFGRALHEVVERLVQARETLEPGRAAVAMPMSPGKTMPAYLSAVALWSAYDDTQARLLPMTLEPPPPPTPTKKRLDPRLVADTGSPGKDAPKMHPGATTPDGMVVPPHPSAPEAYTLDGLYGNMPWGYFLGYSAHYAIGYHYDAKKRGVGDTVFRNHTSVATIVREARGNPALLHWPEADLRPDITHLRKGENEQFVYEIKPHGDVSLEKGKEKLAQYLAVLNMGMIGTSKSFVAGPAYSGELLIMFKRGTQLWRIKWSTTAPGVIQYKWDRPDTKKGNSLDYDERVKEWNEAIANNRWTDISKKEMIADGQDLLEDVIGMMMRRNLLGTFRDGVGHAIDMIGTSAEALLSSHLAEALGGRIKAATGIKSRTSTTQPAPVVNAPSPAQAPVSPARPTQPAPKVNAPSLGSDATPTMPKVNSPSLGSDRRPSAAPRPHVPGKTPQQVSPN